MKYLIPAILIVLCTASFGHAKEWRPILNVALREDIVIAQQNIRGYNNAHIVPAYYPLGAQVTVGLASDRVTGYLAYYSGHSTTIGDSRWDLEQVLVGGRWHPAGVEAKPFRAYVGGGVTITTSRSDVTATGIATSRNDLGAMLEFGIQIPVAKSCELELASQLHRFETEFDKKSQWYGNPHFVVLIPAFQLGLQVMGPKIF